MNVKCESDFVTIFPPGGGHYESPIKEVTKGSVYEIEGEFEQYADYYRIIPDHGTDSMQLPSYMFTPTEEPVTVNPNREQEQQERIESGAAHIREINKEKDAQRIKDNMDHYYDPAGFRKTQENRRRVSNALAQVFVGGLSYD